MRIDQMKPGDWSLSNYGLITKVDGGGVRVDKQITKGNPKLLHRMARQMAVALSEQKH